MDYSYRENPLYLASLDDKNVQTGYDFSVLTSRETIKNIAKSICDSLRHPVTILDINRLGIEQETELRIDSDIEYLSLRGACKLLRHYAGEEVCFNCDNFHATMLKGIERSTTKEELEKRILEKIKEIPSSFVASYTDRIPEVHEIHYQPDNPQVYRLVIEYHCPLLGYRELVLPIFYKDVAIGALFVGQTIIRGIDKETIKNIKEEFFRRPSNNPKEIFSKFLKEQNKNSDDPGVADENDLKQRILDADMPFEKLEDYLAQPKTRKNDRLANMTFDSYDEFNNFISIACLELSKVENKLADDAKEKRKKYFNNIVKNAVRRYFENPKHTHSSKTGTYTEEREWLENTWDCFYKATEEIREELDMEEVLLFGDGVRMTVMENKIKTIYSKDPKLEGYQQLKYDFSKLSAGKPSSYEPLISLNHHDILDGLSSAVDKSNIILLVYPDVVLLLRVEKLENFSDIYTEMAESIGSGFSRIYFDVALRSANCMKEHHTLTLRMYRHESAHVSTRFNDNLSMYFNPESKHYFFNNDEEKKLHVYEDMERTIKLISHIADNIGIITGSINRRVIMMKETYLDVLNLMYKWQIMFKSKLKGRNLDIQVLRNEYKEAHRYIKTNAGLFELLMYNLVDNAVKYAYRGSVIRLSWFRSVDNPIYFELKVSSYGPQIDEGDRPYELYSRGTSYEGKVDKVAFVEGDGMGLYVVKRINDLLYLSGVSHICDLISQYNVPLIQWYQAEPFEDDSFHRCRKKELIDYLNQTPDDALNEIINNSNTKITRRKLSKKYLDARILRKTWLTTFTVKVPQVFGYLY